jgi:clan AA aspartic protease (TIGR02281 family)
MLLLLVGTLAQGEIYKWTDRDGKVHFTDNIWTVPSAYRDQVEEKASTPPGHQPALETPHKLPLTKLSTHTPVVKRYAVPLRRVGNSMMAVAVLNGSVKVPLVVDTGAELTKIPTAAARQLGLNLNDAAVIPLRSTSGIYLAPFTKIKSITVGDATVSDVEVTISDIVPGSNVGLLGMSFLDNFQITIHADDNTMILTSLPQVPGQTLYGGHPEDWWRRKFRFYRSQLDRARADLRGQSSPKLTRTLRYFQAELASLERKASLAAIPRHWRY